jgi:GDP-4-dehydro-6-deoxy-D-mannose reductase
MSVGQPPPTTALITGGTGFVGRHLTRHLGEHGTRVVSLTSNPEEQTNDVPDFRLVDIRDHRAIEELVNQIRPRHVYHLAAITSISAAANDERAAFDVNVWGTRNLLTALSAISEPGKFLNVSTSQVYGESAPCPIVESAPVLPQNTYAVTKAMTEILVQQYSTRFPIINVRPFNHSGPGQAPAFVLSFLAREVAAIDLGLQQPVIRTGDLRVQRDFTDVRDVVRAYSLLLEKGTPGRTYNICCGQAYLLSDALDYLLSLSRTGIRVERDPAKARKGEASKIYGGFDALFAETGWKPRISFQQMLADTFQFWKNTLAASPVARAAKPR